MTRKRERRQYDADFGRVQEFLQQWDPIGIYAAGSEDEWPAEEYDSYVPQVLLLLHAKSGVNGIESYLASVRCQQMGLPADETRDRECAERIEAWWQTRTRTI